MFRERSDHMEIYVSHDLSRKINTNKHERREGVDGDQYLSSKVEMRFCNVRGVI